MIHDSTTDFKSLRKMVLDSDVDVLKELMIELIQMLMCAEPMGLTGPITAVVVKR